MALPFPRGVGAVWPPGEPVPAVVGSCYGPHRGGMDAGGVEGSMQVPPHRRDLSGSAAPVTQKPAHGGANLGKPKRGGEREWERRQSWPSTRTSAKRVLQPCTPLSPFLLTRMAYTTEHPPQLGRISLPAHHLMDTHPWGFLAEVLLLTNLFLFSSAPISSLFSPTALHACPPLSPAPNVAGRSCCPGGLTGGLRPSPNSLHLHDVLRSQNWPLNPGLGTLLQLYKQHKEFTCSRSRSFDNYIKQLDKLNILLLPFFILLN